MKPSHQTMTHFYEHLGKVFYSIAAIDKSIRKEEIEKLKQIIKRNGFRWKTVSMNLVMTPLMKSKLFLTGLSPMNGNWNK
jgi:tRNA C32,U32 (ribose-2'-O)-methylase TrmJ